MKIDWIRPLLGQTPPFVTVYLDTTGMGENAGRDVENRWRALRRSLERDGAPPEIVEQIDDAVPGPTRTSSASGRVIVASRSGIHIDHPIEAAPTTDTAVYGPDPALLPVALGADQAVDHLVVTVDRHGADLRRPDVDPDEPAWTETVEGGHDEVDQVSAGRMSASRIENRAHDSWERNAEAVVGAVNRIVDADAPELVLLTGDVRAVALVRDGLSRKAAARVVEVGGGARGNGVNRAVFEANVREALHECRTRRRAARLAELREGLGRGTDAVSGLDSVVAVIRKGQVSELFVSEAALTGRVADRRVWAGPAPLELALTADELAAIGVTESTREMNALVALVRAALGQDAGLTFLPEDAGGLADGVAATLRWHDDETPGDRALSLSGDQARLSGVR